MKARVIVEVCPNPHCLVFHTTAELTQGRPHHEFRRPLRPHYEEYLKEAGEHGAALVRDILVIDGVNTVSVSSYDLLVVKGEAFDWEDITPKIVDAIRFLYTSKYKVPVEKVEVSTKYDAYKYGSGCRSTFDSFLGTDEPLNVGGDIDSEEPQQS